MAVSSKDVSALCTEGPGRFRIRQVGAFPFTLSEWQRKRLLVRERI
jgi:hypothetical protein